MPLGGRKGGERPRKVTQKSGPYRGRCFSLQMDRQGGGKLGANQYLPGAKAAGKGHTGCVYGEGGERGGSQKVLLGNTYIGPGKPGDRNG